MADSAGDRSKFFPAIEKKHGGPISRWFEELSSLGKATYADQMAYLQENHGFSRSHANAVVMHHRGSTTSRRFASTDAYFASIGPVKARTATHIFDVIMTAFPKLELVMAWNQPMVKLDDTYVFGLSASTNHLTLAPLGRDVITNFAQKLSKYETNKKTFKVPVDWKVDAVLLRALVRYRIKEIQTAS